MFYRERFSVEGVGEHDVRGEQVFKEHTGAGTVLAAEDKEPCVCEWTGLRHNHSLVEVSEADPSPAQRQPAPRGDAMEVADPFNPWQTFKCIGDDEWTFDISDDLDLQQRRFFGETAGKLGYAESRKCRCDTLPGR